MKTAMKGVIVLQGKRSLNVYVVSQILPEFIAKMGRVISNLNHPAKPGASASAGSVRSVLSVNRSRWRG
jgi:hypothetical protein